MFIEVSTNAACNERVGGWGNLVPYSLMQDRGCETKQTQFAVDRVLLV